MNKNRDDLLIRTLDEREKEYGIFRDVAELYVHINATLIDHIKGNYRAKLTPPQRVIAKCYYPVIKIVTDMWSVKIVRLNNKETEDTKLDIEGYSKLLADNIKDKSVLTALIWGNGNEYLTIGAKLKRFLKSETVITFEQLISKYIPQHITSVYRSSSDLYNKGILA